MTKKDDYLKRQVHIMSNLGLFYIILIAFFAVPLLGAFVVVLIKGVVDLKYAIIIGGGILLIFALMYLIKFITRLYWKIREDGLTADREIKEKAGRGEPVQLSVFNGLITFTYGGRRHPEALMPYQEVPEHIPMLPYETRAREQGTGNREQTPDLIAQLKELSVLRENGIISEDEFQVIKTRLIRGTDNSSEPFIDKGQGTSDP